MPSSTIISDISNRFDVNIDWIVSGEGERYKMYKQEEVAQITTGSVMTVSLVNQYAYAGYMSGYADVRYLETFPKILWLVDREYKGKYISFEVKGDSMDDGLKHSDEQGYVLLCREILPEYWLCKLHINA